MLWGSGVSISFLVSSEGLVGVGCGGATAVTGVASAGVGAGGATVSVGSAVFDTTAGAAGVAPGTGFGAELVVVGWDSTVFVGWNTGGVESAVSVAFVSETRYHVPSR